MITIPMAAYTLVTQMLQRRTFKMYTEEWNNCFMMRQSIVSILSESHHISVSVTPWQQLVTLTSVKSFHTCVCTMSSYGMPSSWCRFSRSTFTCCTAMHIGRGERRDIARVPPPHPTSPPANFMCMLSHSCLNVNFAPSHLNMFLNTVLNTCTDCPVSDVWCSGTWHLFYFTCPLRCQVLHKANQATTLPGDPFLLPGELQCFKCECMVTSPPCKHQLMNCIPQHAALCDALSQPVPLLHPSTTATLKYVWQLLDILHMCT